MRTVKSERGVSILELTLILPILLTIIFAILSFGQIFYAWLLVSDAVRLAGREGTIDLPNCTERASSKYLDQTRRFKLPSHIDEDGNPVELTMKPAYIRGSGDQAGVFGLKVQAQVRTNCVLCPFLSAFGVDPIIRSSQFIPYDNVYQQSCKNFGVAAERIP